MVKAQVELSSLIVPRIAAAACVNHIPIWLGCKSDIWKSLWWNKHNESWEINVIVLIDLLFIILLTEEGEH